MKTLKIGKNKGLARIWLERKILSENGWRKGQRFNIKFLYDPDEILLFQCRYSDPLGRHRVSGSDERPVIDLNGQWLQDFFDRHKTTTHYIVDVTKAYHDGLIVIRPVLKTADDQPFLPLTLQSRYVRRPQSMRRFDDVFATESEVRHG